MHLKSGLTRVVAFGVHFYTNVYFLSGAVMVVIVWWFDLQLPVQSVPITTKVVSSNPVNGKVHSMQHYVIKFLSDLPEVSCFYQYTPGFSTNKTDRHNIAEMLLKVALTTINQTKPILFFSDSMGKKSELTRYCQVKCTHQ